MPHVSRSTLGIVLAILGGIGIGGSHYALSILTSRNNPILIMWYISIALFFMSLFLAMTPNIFNNFPMKEFPILMIRSLASVGGKLTIIIAFSHIPVYEGDMMRCTETMFIALMGYCILKQRIRFSMILALVSSIIGILMIYRPPWLIPDTENIIEQVNIHERIIGILIALLSAIFISAYKILGRLIPNIHYRVVCLYENVLHIVLITIIAYAMGLYEMPHELIDWLLSISVGATYIIAVLCYTQAFKYTEAAYAGFASMSFLPTSILLKSFIELKPPNKYDFIGMFCILLSVIICLFAEHLTRLFNWIGDKFIRRGNAEETAAVIEEHTP